MSGFPEKESLKNKSAKVGIEANCWEKKIAVSPEGQLQRIQALLSLAAEEDFPDFRAALDHFRDAAVIYRNVNDVPVFWNKSSN